MDVKEIKEEIFNLIKKEKKINKNFGINTKVDLLIIYAKLKPRVRSAMTDLIMEDLKNVKSYKYGHTERQINQGILKVMNEIIE